jgi:hypothetical protein
MTTSGSTDRRRRAGYVAVWLVAAAVAITVGILAVEVAGAGLRDRGPVGSSDLVGRDDPSDLTPDPDDPTYTDTIVGEYGEFDVECQGVVIRGSEPRTAPGWRVVTYETGPDDDVDATFESADSIIEIEIYCNGGRPALAEQEIGTRPGTDD